MNRADRFLTGCMMAMLAPPVLAQAPASSAAAAPAAVEQQVLDAIERSRAYLRTLGSFEVRVEALTEDVQPDGSKLEALNRVRYEYRAPDRLYASWESDRTSRSLWFDGKTVTVLAPRMGYYAQVPASGTVAEMLRNAAEKQGIIFPLPDLFYWATRGSPDYKVDEARYVGPARLAGVDTDQYFLRQGDLDWQVWIERGERPFPRKFVITDRSDPERPSFRALLGWNPDVKLGDERFRFVAPEGAQQIKFVKLSGEKAK